MNSYLFQTLLLDWGKNATCHGCEVAWYMAVIGPAPVQRCKSIPVLGIYETAGSGGYVVAPITGEYNGTIVGKCGCSGSSPGKGVSEVAPVGQGQQVQRYLWLGKVQHSSMVFVQLPQHQQGLIPQWQSLQ